MIEKDYILRLIEEAGKAVAKAMKLWEGGNKDEAQKTIDKAYVELLKVDKLEILSTANNKLISFLSTKLQLEFGKLEILSLFLAEEAFLEENSTKKKNLTEKALLLIEHINKTDKTFSFERINRTKQLQDMLEIL